MVHLLSALAIAACPSTSADAFLVLERAEAAFQTLDLPAFRTETDAIAATVGCLREQLPRDLIARVHRVEGLRAFVDGDQTRAAGAFAAARAIEPSYRFPETLVPADHPVQVQYLATDPGLVPRAPMLPPVDGRLEIDGRAETGLPEDRPAVVQWIRADGSVPNSVYHWAGGPVFPYPTAPLPVVGLPAPAAERVRHTSRPLSIAAGALVATASGLFAGAAVSRGQYFADDATPAELEDLRGQTNGLFWGSVGAGAAGLGLGVAAVAVHRW
jgi:hypothetical protein